MPDDKGRFLKGEHWREPKPFWERDWLHHEYVDLQRSAAQIAAQFGLGDSAIEYWLKKHGIPARSPSEANCIRPKHDNRGSRNPMYGKRPASWKGGVTPERQSVYASSEWKTAAKTVWRRDRGHCRRCGKRRARMNIHHLITFAVREVRVEIGNLTLLCVDCHRWVHSRKNVRREFLDKFQPALEALSQ